MDDFITRSSQTDCVPDMSLDFRWLILMSEENTTFASSVQF